jgi:Hg(II)-responsive transcriptional regulator
MGKYTIGELAKSANVNIETIRFYERRGLLPKPPRNKSGHRVFLSDYLLRTNFIKRAQALGFSLKEISELLSLRVEKGTTCDDVLARINMKIYDVEKRIADLEDMRDALLSFSKKCTGQGPIGKCPFLEELSKWENTI